MLNPSATREQRFRKTKAQLIDEIISLENAFLRSKPPNRSGAPLRAKAGERSVANQELAQLARFPSENPNPVLRAMPDGAVLYANDAAIAVKGLLVGRKRNRLSRKIAKFLPQRLKRRKPRTELFASGDRLYALALTLVAGETYINIYGRDVTDEHAARQALVAAKEASAAAEATLFDAIENISDGFVLYDSKGRLVLCNSRFRHINQYSEADTKPGICTYESLGRLDAAHGTLGRRLLSFAQRVGKLRRTGNSETIEHLGDRILERRQSITPEGGIVSIQTDISERKRAEEALREQTKAIELLHKVASDANRAQNVEEALQGCLDAVCAHTGWPVGHVYVRSTDERDKLLPSKIWHLDGSKRFAAFRKVTERTTFEPGVGLPGRVLASGKSAWITDVTEDPNFPRAKLAKDIGVKAGFAVPVLVETDVVAVLEFFSPEAVEPDEELLNLLDNVGGQVGRVIERKRADQELAEKEAQLHLALDHMPGGMTLEDRDGNYVLFNAQYSELHDYPEGFLKVGMHSREEVLFQAERGDLGLGNKDELVEQVLGLYPGGKATSWERTFPDGRTLRFNVAPTPEGGTVTIVTEITELKRREQELAAKEAQLRVALDHMPGGMELVDGDRNYVFFNSQYSELHDYPDGLLKVGGSVLDETRFQVERGDYGPGDPDKLMEEAHAPFKSGETGSYERTLPGGRTLYFNVAPTPDGGYVTIVTEITERKRAEQALAEKEAHLRVALDNMPGLLVYTDEDLNIVLCNERFSELYQAQREMLQPGQPYAEFLRCLAEQGYYGEGDAEALVSERIESLRNPSGQTFEELAPDGRVRR